MQLRFTSLAVVNLWEDLNLQARAHAGRTRTSAHRDVRTEHIMDVPAQPVRSPAAAPGRAKSSVPEAG